MKVRLTMRAALVPGMPAVALGVGRLRRWGRAALDQAGSEARRGNLLAAVALGALYLAIL